MAPLKEVYIKRYMYIGRYKRVTMLLSYISPLFFIYKKLRE